MRRTLLLSLWAVHVHSQALLEFINQTPALSSLAVLVNSLPAYHEQLSNLTNFTFLAPNNAAIAAWAPQNYTPDDVASLLSYHVLNGGWPTALFSTVPLFIDTRLDNISYCNVTGGQRVLATKANGKAAFQSGNKTLSGVVAPDQPIVGGLVHITDTVLRSPLPVLQTALDANLMYALAEYQIARSGINYTFYSPIDATIRYSRDLTCFVPNSAAALETVRGMVWNTSKAYSDFMDGHCVLGNVLYSTSLKAGMNLTLIPGYPAVIRGGADGSLYINGARIVAVDYLLANGVLHLIDSVLIPGNTTGPSNIATSTPTPISTPSSTSTHPPSKSRKAALGIGIGVSLSLALVLLLLFTILLSKSKSRKPKPHMPEIASSHEKATVDAPGIELDSREKATELPVHGKGFDQRIHPDAELASPAAVVSPVPDDELALAGPTKEKEIYEMS